MASIPAAFHDLFEKQTFAHLTTMTADGEPHTTPVWIDYDADDDLILVNTERGRRKERNVARDPTVSVSMVDPDNPYRFLSVTGVVESTTTEGARDHIDALAQRYLGEDEYPTPVETERVILRIRAKEVITGDVE
ncbi:pyridoxamine 5'-phosphate oxidase-related FMN- binding [Halorhabdus utahensis DSM 12940]|uniref:Pyridoxamine 5'-phosphate oxidase-related FMN-binding n=1 Tax=Halorhabdus utahensis (strain DSM 12940 / JCM 11049 / AX-2) TaxID=519442 RepID=C7NR91_HALUD|nr:PPOX class F420-dependent oxidoreductase [Halorhabdus utahensis]ACV13083.1 pyridoxamine 5'-phosphate oxidase-related FMN- binding [Halorhabdus utahensis DSM 12940]